MATLPSMDRLSLLSLMAADYGKGSGSSDVPYRSRVGGGPSGARTQDQRVKSPVLYRLS